MAIKATDITTITTAKARVTPTISATRPLSWAWCFAFSNAAFAVELTGFCTFSEPGSKVVGLKSLSSTLGPKQ